MFGPPSTLLLDLPFHAFAGFAAWWLGRQVRRGRLGPAAGLGAFVALASLGAATFSFGSFFHLARNGALVLFVQLPIALVLAAFVLRPGVTRTSALAAGAAVLLGVGTFASLVEPRRLEVTRIRLEAPGLSRPVRIAVLADIQTDRMGGYERSVFAEAAASDPDLVLLPGDYLQADPATRDRLAPELRRLLRSLAPPLGLYAVRGNVEAPDWEMLFEGVEGAVTLDRTATRRPADGLAITGLSLRESFDANATMAPVPNAYHIAFGHAPDFALGDVAADLLVAGHTHGGQVRLPVIGPILTLSRVPRAWAAGTTPLPGGRTLVVSRGIGLERGIAPRIRFLCRPELVVIDLLPVEIVVPRGGGR